MNRIQGEFGANSDGIRLMGSINSVELQRGKDGRSVDENKGFPFLKSKPWFDKDEVSLILLIKAYELN